MARSPSRPPGGQRGEPPTEAHASDVPLLLVVAFAAGLAEEGADIALAARRADRLADTAELVAAAGHRSVSVTADVANPADCQAVADAAMDAFGRIDILISNAGVGSAVPAFRETPEQFRHVIDINLNGCHWMAQACARVMRPGSSIVNISRRPRPDDSGAPQAAHSASKAGLLGLTRDLAQQWSGRNGIQVNTVAPGFFASEMTGQYRPGYLDEQLKRTPLGRMGDPAELTAAVLFLASDASSHVTGQTLAVDGGLTLT